MITMICLQLRRSQLKADISNGRDLRRSKRTHISYPVGRIKEKVNDEQLINLIEAGVQNSVSDWLNSSDLTRERLRSTYEFAGVPEFHLAPQGVSSIVDTSTTEVIEAYTAVLSDLFLNNQKIARFVPMDDMPNS